MVFKNRKTAGQQLADQLVKYQGKDTIILALPRGGVETAVEIAKSLKLPLNLVITRKISHPSIPEYAIAAVSENRVLVENEKETMLIDPFWLKKEVEKQIKEAKRRRQKYMGNKDKVSLKNKIIILVDDGLATGLTMKAAIKDVKLQKPKKIIVAVPIAPKEIAEEIRNEVDDFVAIEIPEYFLGSVGVYYQNFPQLSDEYVIRELKSVPKITN